MFIIDILKLHSKQTIAHKIFTLFTIIPMSFTSFEIISSSIYPLVKNPQPLISDDLHS